MLAGLGCLFAGLCYAEFASMIPVAGSAYTYGYATLGELVAWIIGWDLILEYLFAASTVAVGWSGYFTAFLSSVGLHIPAAFAGSPFSVEGTHTLVRSQLCVDPATGGVAVDAVTRTAVAIGSCVAGGFELRQGIVNLPAMLLVLLVTALLVVGIKESANFNNVIVFVKVAIVFLVIGFGISTSTRPTGSRSSRRTPASRGHFGWSGILRGAGVIFFAYIGFDAVSTAAQEAKNPQRDLPIGILGSLAICTVLYIVDGPRDDRRWRHYSELNVPHPVFVAIEKAGPALAWLGFLVNVGAIAGLASVDPRDADGTAAHLLRDVARRPAAEGLRQGPPEVPARRGSPRSSRASWPRSVAGIFPIALLGELVSIGTLLAFVIVCGGILVLRIRRPELRAPLPDAVGALVPMLGISVVRLHDVRAADRHLDPALSLDGARPR